MDCASSETRAAHLGPSRSKESALRIEAVVGLTLCVAVFWLVKHRYVGLINDAALYALGVLARLHPESLGHDIFLGPGSQNHYTLFSPLAALLAERIGIAHTAAWITFGSQLAFIAAGWSLARRLMSPALALLAIALLATLPDGYGANHIFYAAEPVMTARLPADALVLAAVSATLAGRFWMSATCMVAAALLHPLMATAGLVLLLLMMWMGERRLWLLASLAISALAALWLLTWTMPRGPVSQADTLWLGVLRSRLSYDFPSAWSIPDWGHALVPLATLAVGSLSLNCGPVRVVCRAALATGIGGLCLALVGSDLLHIVLIMEGQPWRWLWIANTLALLLIPVIVRDCACAGPASQGALLLVAAAWIGIDTATLAALAIPAVAIVALQSRIGTSARARLLLYSGALLLLLSFVLFTTSLLNDLRGAAALLPATPSQGVTSDQLDAWIHEGVLPAALFAFLWWFATRWRNLASSMCALLAGVALCCAFAPFMWHTWTDPARWETWHERFADWRREIPPDAEVLAPRVPDIPWFVLGRPSYWSLTQMAGMVFSRPAAMELVEREKRVRGFLSPRHPLRDLTSLCTGNPSLAYFISPTDLGATHFAPVDVGPPAIPGGRLRLYRCADYRH